MRTHGTGLHLAIAAATCLGFAGLLTAAEAQYVGQSKCKACHLNEHKAWAANAHARAIEVLKPEERTRAECLGCHTTGYGKPAAAGTDLNGVQCEACHGPGSLYKSMDVMSKSKYQADRASAHATAVRAGLLGPDEKTCTSCHNQKSPNFKGFDFASAKEKIKHWK
ncbi:MAG: hypothetical protein HY510_01100 [Acidobacteria bacterium]|nr:hypothetical protein [Acidobacteriota bacterium]